MKKNNTKFRNNGNSNAYSLNYKFDSISPAGKYSGTALDLIKRYNELAKEAHGNGDFVAVEVYRQYAEHYRKIVTEINERRAARQEAFAAASASAENDSNAEQNSAEVSTENTEVDASTIKNEEQPTTTTQKTFKVIEITPESNVEKLPETEALSKPVKTIRRRKICATPAAEEKTAAVM